MTMTEFVNKVAYLAGKREYKASIHVKNGISIYTCYIFDKKLENAGICLPDAVGYTPEDAYSSLSKHLIVGYNEYQN